MEHEKSSTGASPRNQSTTEAAHRDSTFQSRLTDEASDAPDGSSRCSRLESRAAEMYCDILLSRAHFLFFSSLRTKDVTSSIDLYSQGKKVLEEAERICMGDKHFVGDQSIAKCWYVRGFHADIDGDKQNAVRCFEQATVFDKFYATLKRVMYYQHRRGDADEMDGYWSGQSQSSEYRNRAYRRGEVGSGKGEVQRSSLGSQDTESSAYRDLKALIRKAPQYPQPRSGESVMPLPVTPTSINHSTPVATPPTFRSPDRIGALMKELQEKPSRAAGRRPSEDLLNHFGEHGNPPENDPTSLLLDKKDAE